MKKLMKKAPILFVLALIVLLSACSPASTPAPAAPTEAPVVSPTEAATVAAPTEPPAAAPTEPPSQSEPADGVERITIEELKAMMDSGKNVLVLDARPRESYQLEHIKGAMSLPWKPEFNLADVEDLPSGIPIVTYCDCGPGEADGADTARQLIEMGFKDVKALADPSIEGWVAAGYPTD